MIKLKQNYFRLEKFTTAKTKTVTTFTIKNKHREMNEKIIKIIYDFINENDLDFPCSNRNRINHCQAWYSYNHYIDTIYGSFEFVMIKSYNTIVAIYLPEFQLLISFGSYSMTTYQHIRKYYENNRFAISYHYNMNFVNWFD